MSGVERRSYISENAANPAHVGKTALNGPHDARDDFFDGATEWDPTLIEDTTRALLQIEMRQLTAAANNEELPSFVRRQRRRELKLVKQRMAEHERDGGTSGAE